ncbi:MAG TPA: hypothetical protein VFX64_01945 [Candidatus Nitrosotalea sp.]|nr:hypothetical protein [Candidatus Nitrosotalea sp.]
MKIQNNKTKTTTTIISALIIGLVLLSPTTVLPSVNATVKTAVTIDNVPIPIPLSGIELQNGRQLALTNSEVHDMINGKPYEFMAYDFIGNVKTEPGIWYPEIHINVDNNTQIAVVFDPKITSVRNVGIFPMIDQTVHPKTTSTSKNLGTSGAAFAIDYYSGSQSQIYGLYETVTAPTFTNSGTNYFSGFVVNALESGANYANSCDRSHVYDSYWAQAGLVFKDQSTFATWSDTSTGSGTGPNSGCHPLALYGNTYSGGDTLIFKIISRVVSGSPNWLIYGHDVTSGSAFFSQPETGMMSSTVTTGNEATSVWFENQNNSTLGSNWYQEFSSNPSASAYYFDSSGSVHNWDGSTRFDMDCSGQNYTYSYPNQVIVGDLLNGGTPYWDMTYMKNYDC